MFRRDDLDSIDRRLAMEVLRQIQAHGFDGVRVALIADRLEIAVGTLYSRWGGRQALMEHTWRMCLASVEYEVHRMLTFVGPNGPSFDVLAERFCFALPEQLDAFFELHSARRRWHRGELDPDGIVVPSLETYMQLCQRYGHFRDGPPRTLAAFVWWTFMSALSGGSRQDKARLMWCIGAMKRVLFTRELLAAEEDRALDQIDITVQEATPDL